MADDFEKLFATAPKPVVDYFDRRPNVPTFDWRDIAPREHALAFTVAKTANFDVIKDLRDAVRQAVVDQIPFERFQKQLTPILQQKGWWGRQLVKDGDRDVLADLGSPRRLRTIYNANVASAYAAGEWSRIQETKEFLPYLRYLTSISERKRPEHLSWVGTTLPADDDWWKTHFPPNAWNCKCRVEQISGPEARRAPKDKQQAPPLDMREWRNRRTGAIENIPSGIDPGWQHNPGMHRDRTLSRQLTSALDRMPHGERSAAIAKLRDHPVFRYVAQNESAFPHKRARDPDVAPRGRFFTAVASAPDALAGQLGAKTRTVALSLADGAKQVAQHGDVDVADYAKVQEILDAPDRAIVDRGKLIVARRIDDQWWSATIKLTSVDELLLNSFHRLRPKQVERDFGE